MPYQCPMCGKSLGDDFKVYMEHMEREIIEVIKREHPDWEEGDGTCTKCYEYYKKQIKG